MHACMHTYIHTYIHTCMHAFQKPYGHRCVKCAAPNSSGVTIRP